MGMSAGGGGGKKRAVAEINVTPMVDVMLVLLVIFMITAPSIKQIEGIEVELPVLTDSAAEQILTEDARTLAILQDGTVVRPGSKSDDKKPGQLYPSYETMKDLIADLKKYNDECKAAQKKPVVVIAGHRSAEYQRVMQVWNAVKSAGIKEVCFQVESKQ
jgi:biopolymer transport protein TolR